MNNIKDGLHGVYQRMGWVISVSPWNHQHNVCLITQVIRSSTVGSAFWWESVIRTTNVGSGGPTSLLGGRETMRNRVASCAPTCHTSRDSFLATMFLLSAHWNEGMSANWFRKGTQCIECHRKMMSGLMVTEEPFCLELGAKGETWVFSDGWMS